jgi:uncharacterized repeat protein (TIGR02543 family)
MPNKNTTTLTFSNSDVNTFRVYDDGGKNSNVKWGSGNYGNGALKLTAPAGCTFTVSGSVDLYNVSNNTDQYVAVYDGHETTNTQLAKVTGNNTLGPVTSNGNTMMIYYHLGYPGSFFNMPGFALTVTINNPNRKYAVNVVTPVNGSLTASSATAKAGATVTLTATPAAGYALDQLTVLDAAQQPVTVTSSQFTMPNGPVVAAAKFMPVYTVSFNANGHGTAPDAQTVMQGRTASAPAAPTAEGYDFGGWYTTAACTGDAYDFTSAVSAHVELFAKWTATTYYLNYDLMGGTVATDNPISYTIKSAAITLINPTRTGYDFAGWMGTDLTDATMTVTIASGSTGNRDYIATWTPSDNISLTANPADENYWTTFYCGDAGYTIDDGENAWAYTATVSGNELTLHKLGKVIPKGNAVILVGADNSISMTASDETATVPTNNLQGYDVRTSVADIKTTLGDGTLYVMGKVGSNFGFFEYTDAYMPARKAFLFVSGSAAPGLKMVFDDESTEIKTTDFTDYTDKADTWYSLDGRKLDKQPTAKGIYIHNGRKEVVR